MTPDQIRWLTWGAIQHRPRGARRWDEPGTAKAITEHCGTWALDAATEHVLAHARDPKAETPFVIKGNPPHNEPVRAARQPAKAGVAECRVHPGEWSAACRACAADRLAGERDVTPPQREKAPPEVAHRGAAACRASLGLPASQPLSPADEDPVVGRPEIACSVDGCSRPTRDGICDRCRAQAIRDAEQAGNAELIAQLHENERRRAANRPEPSPEPPRKFTSADIDHDRVRAAMTRAATGRALITPDAETDTESETQA